MNYLTTPIEIWGAWCRCLPMSKSPKPKDTLLKCCTEDFPSICFMKMWKKEESFLWVPQMSTDSFTVTGFDCLVYGAKESRQFCLFLMMLVRPVDMSMCSKTSSCPPTVWRASGCVCRRPSVRNPKIRKMLTFDERRPVKVFVQMKSAGHWLTQTLHKLQTLSSSAGLCGLKRSFNQRMKQLHTRTMEAPTSR